MCLRALFALSAIACLSIAHSHATTCFDYDQILPEVDRVALAAEPIAIVVGGSHAFVAVSGAGLQVVDVSDPAALVVIATLGGLGTLKDVALDGTLLYAGSTTGLHVIDVSDPALPVVLGSAPGSLESVDFHGKTVAAAAGTSGLRYYDVTDPTAPAFVSALPLSGGTALEVLAHGDLFYAIAGNTLYAASIDPGMPSVLGQTFAFSTRGLAAEGELLFNWQMFYSIANPSSPVLVGAYYLPSSPGPSAPEVVGGTAFYSGYTVLQVVDIDTAVPSNSRLLGFADFSNWPMLSIEIAGGYAYIGTRDNAGTAWRLHVIDVETALVPSPMTVLDTPGNASDVAVQGNYAYVADGKAGLQIVDIADPWAPVIVGSVETPAVATHVAVAGNLACVKQGTDLQVVDVSDPANPILRGIYPSLVSYSGIAMTPGFAYVQVQTQMPRIANLRVIDLSNPASPVLAGSVAVGGGYTRIEITGTTACLLAPLTQFVDISDPTAPVLVGSTFVGASPMGMAVDGTRVYINEIHGRFLAYDISNAAMPVALPSLQYSTFRYTGAGMAASRSTVYVYSGNFGLWTVNVGNSSASPKIVAGTVLETPVSFSMRIADDVIVAAVGSAGLLVLPTQCFGVTDIGREETTASQRVVLRAAWPNPARVGTTLQFELPVATAAAVRIYDVAGRIVRELRSGQLQAGSHSARWDGLDAAGRRVANGVYITRLETPLGTSAGRVTLVR